MHLVPSLPLSRFARRVLPPLLAAFAGFVFSGASSAAVDAKMSFDVPAGNAAQTLKQFAVQAGREIVFAPDVVANVRTVVLRGQLTPAEALQMLLAGTGLVAGQDQRTGAFAVRKADDPNGARAVPADAAARPKVGALDSLNSGEAVELSPFVVNTTKDVGFVAATSLAGGRLAGDLKDTPVAYSVLTSEFLQALNLTDLNTAMQWMPGTYLNDGDNNTRLGSANDMNIITIRGRQLNSPQRNFFPFSFNFDNFNLERMDLARGANSVLFGNGGYGGNPNSVTKRAETSRDFSEVRYSYGSFASNRATFDYNVAAGKKFAVRGNLLWMDNRSWREHDFVKRKGAALAATWKLSPRTELRAEAEQGLMQGNIALGYIADRLSGWDGTTTYSTQSTGTNNAAGTTRYSSVAIYTPTFANNTLINFQNVGRTVGGNDSAAVPVGGQLVAGATANVAGSPILDAVALSDNRFGRAIAGSKFRLPGRQFTTIPDETTRQDISRAYTLGFTHQFSSSLFLDVAGNISQVHKWGNPVATRGISDVYIDINRNLPTGTPNPKFLVPYSEASGNYRFPNDIDAKNLRAALGYLLNTTRWGSYKFNLVGGMSRQTTYNATYNYALARNSDPRFWPSELLIRFRYYWDDTSRPQPTPATWNYIDPVSGLTTQARADFFRNNASLSSQDYNYVLASTAAKFWRDRIHFLGAVRRDLFATWRQDTLALRDNAATWDAKTDVFKPTAPADYFALAYVPKDATGRPVGAAVPALTRPRDSSGFSNSLYASDRFQDDYSAPKVPGGANTYTVGTVVHGTPWMSAFVNYGTTYNLPPISGQRLDRSVAPGTIANGWDYGLRFSLLKDKVVANLIRYRGESTGYGRGAFQNGTVTNDDYINQILRARPIGNTNPSDINARGAALLPNGFYDSSKGENDGYELDLTANLSRSWRLLLNGSLVRTFNASLNPESQGWLSSNDALLRNILRDTGVTVGANNVATVNLGSVSLDAPAAATGWNNIQNVLAAQALDRIPTQNTSTGNLFTDYIVREGKLKNLRFGGGVNWRGRRIIGNRGADTKVDPSNPAQAIRDLSLTALNSVYTPSYFTGTVTLAYSYKFAGKYTFVADLRVANIFDYKQPIYSTTALRPRDANLANPARAAVPYMLNYLTPRTYTLTTSVKF